MRGRISVVILVSVLLSEVVPVVAQFRSASVNPEALQFENSLLHAEGATGYRVEIFMAGADTRRDFPVKSMDVAVAALDGDGRVRVTLKDKVLDVPNGTYVATIRTLGLAISRQSEPSEVFVLNQPGTPQDRETIERQERRWTRIALVVGASILIVPMLFR